MFALSCGFVAGVTGAGLMGVGLMGVGVGDGFILVVPLDGVVGFGVGVVGLLTLLTV